MRQDWAGVIIACRGSTYAAKEAPTAPRQLEAECTDEPQSSIAGNCRSSKYSGLNVGLGQIHIFLRGPLVRLPCLFVGGRG
jgi:hypothetical protein